MQTESASQPRLLKANAIRGLGSKVVFNLEDLRERGEAYVESVRKQAQHVLESTQAELDIIRAQARQQGLEEGRREGFADADKQINERARKIAEQSVHEQIATLIPAIRAAAEILKIERDRWLSEWEGAAVRLAAAIAQRILQRSLQLKPELVRDSIRGALDLAAGSARIALQLHPDDAALLGPEAAEVARAMTSCGELEIVPDPSIPRGGCVVQTQHGTIDGRLETMIERIVSELTEDTV